MTDLSGKVAFVTGGSRGIGAAVVQRLAQSGADVAFTYRAAQARAQQVSAAVESCGRRALALQADGADRRALEQAIDHAAEAFGRIDILVNNAGIFVHGPIGESTLEELDQLLALHVAAPWWPHAPRCATCPMAAASSASAVASPSACRCPASVSIR